MKEKINKILESKYFWIALISIVIILLIYWIIVQSKKSTFKETNVKIEYKDLKNLSFQSLIAKQEIPINMSAVLTNPDYTNSVTGLRLRLYFMNTEIAHSSDHLAEQTFEFNKDGKLYIEDTITYLMNDAGFEFLKGYLSGREDFAVDAKINVKILLSTVTINVPSFNLTSTSNE